MEWLEVHPEIEPHESHKVLKLDMLAFIDPNFLRFLGKERGHRQFASGGPVSATHDTHHPVPHQRLVLYWRCSRYYRKNLPYLYWLQMLQMSLLKSPCPGKA